MSCPSSGSFDAWSRSAVTPVSNQQQQVKGLRGLHRLPDDGGSGGKEGLGAPALRRRRTMRSSAHSSTLLLNIFSLLRFCLHS